MMKIERKLERISNLEHLLLAHPEGLKPAEIARKLGIHRSTAGRYLTDVTGILPVYEDDGKVKINRDHYLNNVRLNIHEIMVLHLAARLFTSRMDKQNPHACAAMRKLGNCLQSYSNRMSEFMLAASCEMERDTGSVNKEFIAVLENLTRAWSDGVWLHVSYFSQKSGEIHEYDFAPWFVQPYPAGYSIYAVGYCREKNQKITLKVERIRKAELTDEKYSIPESFDPEKLFRHAWGIWYSEDEPVEVVLEFSHKVADRVMETVWHKGQSIEKKADGTVFWKAQIAEPLEMLPWIRGWGSDCKVIAPDNLLKMMRDEARKLGEMYG